MPLEMKKACMKCAAPLDPAGDAVICSFECTFCPECSAAMNAVCPNCGGELLPRPRRRLPVSAAAKASR